MGHFITGKAVRVVPGASKYGHRFGGRPLHRMIGRKHRTLNVHCLYVLNTDDPALPSLLKRRRWLPLYYPLFNDACDFAYKVVSDTEIAVHLLTGATAFDDCPYDGYPAELPEHSVRLESLSYSTQKTLVFAFTAFDNLNDDALSTADRQFIKRSGYPFTQIGGIQRMIQGVPEQRCPNKECKYAEYSNMHDVFAVVWNNPVPGFKVWGEYSDYSQLIFQLCPKCSTIYVCNRCD